jgi:hypothetical protein
MLSNHKPTLENDGFEVKAIPDVIQAKKVLRMNNINSEKRFVRSLNH